MPLGPLMKFSLDHMGRGIRVIKVLAMKAVWTGESRFQGGIESQQSVVKYSIEITLSISKN